MELYKKPENGGYTFNYKQIQEVYNASLLDIYLNSPEAYLLKKKEDAKLTIAHMFKQKFEEKLIFQQMADTRTLRKEKTALEQKVKMIGIDLELSKQRLEWLLYDTPYSLEELENEVK